MSVNLNWFVGGVGGSRIKNDEIFRETRPRSSEGKNHKTSNNETGNPGNPGNPGKTIPYVYCTVRST